ncbi:cupin domain-containing protein [Aureimonas leprariae]|uniref:Cupin domain-containing protein n=1 Tax=Plantimonas leprariae TaxID=2615207 RepID=A0A7V7TWI5_9HYPH|nr:cupin domain-containing protein [Aureimonas leprariae]KAB0680008.1 cupin domain-containing protein [Aureimonas leprariae]
MPEAVNLEAKLSLFHEPWSPKIVTTYNDNDIMVVKFEGEFPMHKHPDTDDFFLVLDGHVTIETEEGDVELRPGELYVVPKGVMHRPIAHGEAKVLLIEPKGLPNSGDPATAATKVRI